jgi:type II secretory pathway component PulF
MVSLHAFSQKEETKRDTTRMNMGKVEIILIDHSDEAEMDTIDAAPGDSKEDKEFEAHWAGLDMGFLMLMRSWTATESGRKKWDSFQLRIPGYGSVLRHRYYAQFGRTLGTLILNGVTLVRALELIQDIAGNAFILERMKQVQRAVVDGVALSNAIAQQKLFPELFVDMLAVGEQSGRLGETLNNVADVYDRELDKQVKLISTPIPPLVMVGIAIVVGFVVFGILSAVFSMTKGLRPGGF